jgi:demethylmenaquinone methyltransferase/2-methoxy-6-polyprenyl-1,4-benzoquinol methylase
MIISLNPHDKHNTITPYHLEGKSKKQEVAMMFNNISPRYDLLNRVLSLGIDKRWRKKAVNILKKSKPENILDIATGTGDFAIECLNTEPMSITGMDISKGMLDVGRKKITKLGYENKIQLIEGDAESMPFDNNKFDAATVAFGVRNFEDLNKGLNEILRVLRPGGMIMILEFSKPSKFPFKQVYWFYFKYILPFIGKMISKDASAYDYLPQSVQTFPHGSAFISTLNKCGFVQNTQKELTFGVATIYTGKKPID